LKSSYQLGILLNYVKLGLLTLLQPEQQLGPAIIIPPAGAAALTPKASSFVSLTQLPLAELGFSVDLEFGQSVVID